MLGLRQYWPRLGISAIASLLLFTLYPSVLEAASQSDFYDLIDDLFDDYRKEVRPVSDNSNSTVVDVTFWMLNIINLDEQNQIFETSVVIQLSWVDEWLTWDPADYGQINSIRYPQEKLWLPDIVIVNSVERQTQLGYKESPCLIDYDGEVTWRPSEILFTSCDMDVTYYPFDTQKCSIILSTWVSNIFEIDLELDEDVSGIRLDRYSPSGTWELLDTSMTALPDEAALSRLEYTFKLKRLSTFYVLNIIVPILLLSFTASAVFYLPAEAGEKIGMSMTVLLAFAVYMSIISENMPQTSLQVSILSVYLAILLGLCGLSVIMSVYILHLHHRPDEHKVGRITRIIIRKIRKVLRFRHYKKKKTTTIDESDKNSSGPKNDISEMSSLEAYLSTNPNITHMKMRHGKVYPYESVNGKIDYGKSDATNENSLTPHTTEKSNKEKETDEEKITWTLVAETLDSLFFVSTSAFIMILTLTVMTLLLYGGNQ